MRRSFALILIAAGFTLAGTLYLRRPDRLTSRVARTPVASPLATVNASLANPQKAQAEYKSYVARNAASRDPKVQDQVGAANMRLGYLAAKSSGLPKARAAFLAAAKIQGTGASGAFGSVGDQAAYQAVVCLVAEGKKAEAVKGFEGLLRDRPLSPLARAAYRRLKRLNGGESKPEWDQLMQTAVSKQEARVRFETSVCGPKCLEHIFQSEGESPGDHSLTSATVSDRKHLTYQTVAKLCGTTDAGTTVEGMRKGLLALGHESWAVRLNREDLPKAKLPAILLEGDHYVVLQAIEGDAATLWDPSLASTRPWKLPPADDPDFAATLILLNRPEGI